MKFVLLIFMIILSMSVEAGDKYFKSVQPVDDYIAKKLKWENTELAGKLSDYGMGAMMVAPYGYALAEKKDRWKRVSTVAVVQILNVTFVDTIKVHAKRTRPNGKNDRSFFSGHTSSAFTGAGLICAMDNKSCPGALLVAASVGYFRIAADWHWFSDVAVGAGIGYFNGKYVPQMVISF